ncbi:MAG: TIGR03761 family integrating conjugative element protein [Gammaproteobacteria bacterium]|nr:TIGR03761 family integrating conjugative element protein [Gammaproteobacteria bacterium]
MQSDTPASAEQIANLNPQLTLGALRGQAWLTVQTRQAQRLIQGRNGSEGKPAIIGLVGFADRLRLIWHAARNDDPYADWWLIRIHEAIEQARAFIRQSQSEIDEKLAQSSAIEIETAASLRPYRIPLQFANPYAYQGAHLIGEYDTLVRTLLSGCHVGLLKRASSEQVVELGGRRIRGTFTLPQGYRFLGIDRTAVRRQIEKAQRAQSLMGDLPPAVLSGEQQAPQVPSKRHFPEGYRKAATQAPSVPSPDAQRGEE